MKGQPMLWSPWLVVSKPCWDAGREQGRQQPETDSWAFFPLETLIVIWLNVISGSLGLFFHASPPR